MRSPPDNFDSLRKVLRVKRHEQPPPRYFNEFASHVMARIENRWRRLVDTDGRPVVGG